MKKTLLKFALAVCICILGVNNIHSQQLAFPGAEGFGRYATGARAVSNPEVYRVTNLNDSGTGSLRDAVSKPGRIVVFDVSGVIKLKTRIVFSANSYIAGHTAPGDGIIVYGDGVSFSGANNIIVRYMRIYMGRSGAEGKDAGGVANGRNMIFDHCSFMWGRDENFSINWDEKGTKPLDITIQDCLIGQGLMTHSAGGLIQTDGGVSIIGCLYIDNKTRNAKVKGLNQFINNVVYNWSGSDGYILGGTTESSWAWLEGNYFICGPNSSSPFSRATTSFQLYQKNNNIDLNKNGVLDGREAANTDFGTAGFKNSLSEFTGIPKAHPEIEGGILSPNDALNKVIASVGASLPVRTAPEVYVVDELVSYGKKGVLISNENQNGIYQNVGVVSDGPKLQDTDGDGIPDVWETANGLNPNDPSDAAAKAANGYLNIENYINGIDAPISPYVRCASDIKMTDRTISSVTLSWKNNALESDGILLQKSDDGNTFTTIKTLTADDTSFEVTGLEEETVYYFRLVTKKNGLADSTPSEVLKVLTAGTPKAPYQSFSPSPGADAVTRFFTEVTFFWENETGPWAGDVTYDIYLGESADNMTVIASGIAEKTYIYENAGLTMNSTYYWRVDAKNTLGTVEGVVWSFKAGTYSFSRTLSDLGRDFICTGNPGTGSAYNAVSGSLFSGSSKNYTVRGGSADEVKYTVSGDINSSGSGNVYIEKVANSTFINAYLTNDSHYLDGTLTSNSSTKSLASVVINGTSAAVDEGVTVAILFSDKYPFSTQSIIGYEEIELPPVRKGENVKIAFAPVDSKSFRVYRKVTISPSSENEDIYVIGGSYNALAGTGGSPRIAYIGSNLELVTDHSKDAIENNITDENGIFYADGFIYNKKQENVLLLSSTGMLILSSDEDIINVQDIPKGVYIAKTETKVLKFIR